MNTKKKTRYLSLVLLLAITIGIIPLDMVNAEPPLDIKVQLDSEPMIDVVLSLGETGLDATNFERDLKKKLTTKGVNTSKVNITAIDTQEQDMQNTFDWNEDVLKSIGSISFQNHGSTIKMLGNPSNPGFNKIYTDNIRDPEIKEQEMKFSFSLNYGDSFDAAGVLINVDEVNGSMNGYALAFPAKGNARLFELTNWNSRDEIWIGGHSSGGTINSKARQIATFNLGLSGNFTLKSTKDEVSIYKNNSLVGTAKLPRHSGFGFGFFADHYSHGCQNIGQFSMTDLELETTKSKEFTEVIRQPSWRNGSERYLVNFEDNSVADFDKPTALGEILTRLINEGIHYLAVGSNSNKTQAQNLIARNNGNGAFYSNSNYNTAMENVANYIKNRIPPADSGTGDKYVVMGEPFKLSVSPSSLLHNTQNAEYPLGRWRVDHEYDYYDNDLGQADWANQWQKDLKLDLDKPGKYELFFGTQNPEPRYIYVHRRPIADFNLSVARKGSTYDIAVRDTSYDPDKEYSSNKGIVAHEWKWKETDSNTWTSGKVPSTLPVGKNYIVQLRVKDEQGEWSIPEARFITTDNVTVPPVASFTASPNPVSMYETLNVSNNSYDPAGRPLNAVEWKVSKGGKDLYTSTSAPLTSFRNLGEGVYLISLKVRNNANLWSETYSRNIRVTTDTSAPSALVNPVRMDATKNNIDVTVKYSDTGGSGFKHQRYALTTSPTAPSSGWSAWDVSTTRNVTISSEGKHYLHLEALDNANNKYTRTAGDYLLDRTPPTLKITQNSLAISHEDTSMLIDAKDNLSGIEKVTYTSNTGDKGTVVNNKVTVRQNGIYTFVAEDKAGNKTTTVYEVKNLDKTISFIAPKLTNFNNFQLAEKATKLETSVGDMVIKDWRDDATNYWRIDVSASQFTNNRGQAILPKGSLTLKPYSLVDKKDGTITKGSFNKELVIDDGARTVIDSRNARGQFNVKFSNDCLGLTIDPTTAKVGDSEAILTWNLIVAP